MELIARAVQALGTPVPAEITHHTTPPSFQLRICLQEHRLAQGVFYTLNIVGLHVLFFGVFFFASICTRLVTFLTCSIFVWCHDQGHTGLTKEPKCEL